MAAFLQKKSLRFFEGRKRRKAALHFSLRNLPQRFNDIQIRETIRDYSPQTVNNSALFLTDAPATTLELFYLADVLMLGKELFYSSVLINPI